MSDPASQAPDHPPAAGGESEAFAVGSHKRPPGADAVLVLADGEVYWGRGAGAAAAVTGEVCFNTAMTGYQETLTDPSYAGQIITFTFPHIGNVGANPEDLEATTPAARGLVLRAEVTGPSSHRAKGHLDDWLRANDLVGISGVDTRRLTRHLRDRGAQAAALVHDEAGAIDAAALEAEARAWPGLAGMDLAREVTCRRTYSWDATTWTPEAGFGRMTAPRHRVVAVDYGAKRNILRCLASQGCAVTVVPATTSAEEILGHEPDGVFLDRKSTRLNSSHTDISRMPSSA